MWWSFHSERWVSRKQFTDTELEELKDEIKGRFSRFKERDLPEMVEILAGLRELKLESPGA